MEGAYLIATGSTFSQVPGLALSTQQLLDCETGGKWISAGCNGGYSDETFAYTAENGLSLASAYTPGALAATCQMRPREEEPPACSHRVSARAGG